MTRSPGGHLVALFVLVATLASVCVPASAATTPFASAIYSYDRVAHSSPAVRASIARLSGPIAAPARTRDGERRPTARLADFLAAKAGGGADDVTRVGRWMSQEEFDAMSAGGRVIEGGGGRTYVVRPPNPDAYRGASPGSAYAEFNVPSSSLRPASQPDWAVIPGPNVTTRRYGPPPSEMPPATCISLVCRK